jgi:hypothetical protein
MPLTIEQKPSRQDQVFGYPMAGGTYAEFIANSSG